MTQCLFKRFRRSVPSALDIHLLLCCLNKMDESWIFHTSKYLIMPFALIFGHKSVRWNSKVFSPKALKMVKHEKSFTVKSLNLQYHQQNVNIERISSCVMWAVCDCAKYRIQFSKTSDSRAIMKSIVGAQLCRSNGAMPFDLPISGSNFIDFHLNNGIYDIVFFSMGWKRERFSSILWKTRIEKMPQKPHTSTWNLVEHPICLVLRVNKCSARRWSKEEGKNQYGFLLLLLNYFSVAFLPVVEKSLGKLHHFLGLAETSFTSSVTRRQCCVKLSYKYSTLNVFAFCLLLFVITGYIIMEFFLHTANRILNDEAFSVRLVTRSQSLKHVNCHFLFDTATISNDDWKGKNWKIC